MLRRAQRLLRHGGGLRLNVLRGGRLVLRHSGVHRVGHAVDHEGRGVHGHLLPVLVRLTREGVRRCLSLQRLRIHSIRPVSLLLHHQRVGLILLRRHHGGIHLDLRLGGILLNVVHMTHSLVLGDISLHVEGLVRIHSATGGIDLVLGSTLRKIARLHLRIHSPSIVHGRECITRRVIAECGSAGHGIWNASVRHPRRYLLHH